MYSLSQDPLIHISSFVPLYDLSSLFQTCKWLYKSLNIDIMWFNRCKYEYNVENLPKHFLTWEKYYKEGPDILYWSETNKESSLSIINKTTIYKTGEKFKPVLALTKGKFGSWTRKYVFDVRINFKQMDFYYGFGFIDTNLIINFKENYIEPNKSQKNQ